MKEIALVIVHGGVAYVAAPKHVDVRVIDQDNIKAGDEPTELPRNVGFEFPNDWGRTFTYHDAPLSAADITEQLGDTDTTPTREAGARVVVTAAELSCV